MIHSQLILFDRLALTTLREFKMLHIMNQITDKPEWHVKVRRFRMSLTY